MATKKSMTDEPFGKIADTSPAVIPYVSPESITTAIPVVAAVDATYVVQAASDREVVVNKHYRELMAYLIVLRDSFHDGQVQADFNQAIMATRTAHLWALQAVKNVS